MTKRQTPPGRISKLCVVVVKPYGPHHCAKCLGSVHSEKTRSRGAANSRTPMIDRGSRSRSMLLPAAMPTLLLAVFDFRGLRVRRLGFCLLGLQRPQIEVEPIEALVVEAAIVVEPVVNILERARLDPAGPRLRLARAGDQAGALEHLEMLRDRRETHRKGFGELHDRGLAERQA